MDPVKELSLKEILNIDNAIKRIRDTKTADGMTIPGCTFPFKIMYQTGKIEGQIEGRVKAYNKAKEAKIKAKQVDKPTGEKDAEGKPIIAPWLDPKDSEKIGKELEKEIEKIDKELQLYPYSLKAFMEMEDDDYYKEANKNSPVPQEFFSLMGRMIVDDTADEQEKEEAKK